VLVLGGSQGALAVNTAIDDALAAGRWPPGVQLVWQTGAATYERFSRHHDGATVLVRPFLDPIAEAYAAADAVVSRAGAMTIAELCAWGLPAVLIPLPTAAAGHQLTNAKALASAGAAVLLLQGNATAETITGAIRDLLWCPGRGAAVSAAATARARPDAAAAIAARALQLL
jgi:UDP-N-acetylglucosamine--N-acetylmuramyl-(pentapeptide) pyrophosphoryl-undecaprenol N-acetylglucosamine transferase